MKFDYYVDFHYHLRQLLLCVNPEVIFSNGAWPYNRHLFSDELIDFIASNPEMIYDKTDSTFIVTLGEDMVKICQHEAAERILLGQ